MAGKAARRTILKAAGVGAAGLAAGAFGLPYILRRARGENIILIIADAMRGDVIGKIVAGREVTPNINRLAAGAVNFSNAYSAAPGTKFSMASILSGMLPPGHGVEHPRFTLPARPSAPGYLRSKGWNTASVVTNAYLAPELGPGNSVAPIGFGFNAAFDYYRYLGVRKAEFTDDIPEEMRRLLAYASGEMLNDHVRAFFDRREAFLNGASPLFLYLHYMDSHQPWMQTAPIPGITGIFHDAGGAPEDEFAADAELILRVIADKDAARFSAEDMTRLRAVYLESCAYVDRCIGELFDELRRRGAFDNATVIVTADHGEEFGEHGWIGHAKNLFNTSLHIPLVIKRPGATAKTVDARVSNAMILPTVMGWFGDEHPGTNLPPLEPYIDRPEIGDAEVFASFYGRDKVITTGGASAMRHGGGYLFFGGARGPEDLAPSEENARALEAMKKARAASERLAKDAGVERRFSTYAWQNPDAPAQAEAAAKAVAAGEMSEMEAVIAASRGAFLPERSEARLKAETGVDGTALTREQREQLQALGYLN